MLTKVHLFKKILGACRVLYRAHRAPECSKVESTKTQFLGQVDALNFVNRFITLKNQQTKKPEYEETAK